MIRKADEKHFSFISALFPGFSVVKKTAQRKHHVDYSLRLQGILCDINLCID